MGEEKSAATGRPRRSKVVSVLFVLVLVLLTTCAFLLVQYRRALDKQPQTDKQRIAAITALIDGVVMLPAEEPTIATVADKRKLTDPQLAAQAQNGDQILVYSKAQRVILYRPSVHKVVDMFRVQAAQVEAKAGAR